MTLQTAKFVAHALTRDGLASDEQDRIPIWCGNSRHRRLASYELVVSPTRVVHVGTLEYLC